MNNIDRLMAQYPQFDYRFMNTPDGLGGLTINDKIIIDKKLPFDEQLQWLYEEIGHALTSTGDITDYYAGNNYQQEKRARNWGVEHQVPLNKLKKMTKGYIGEDYELADTLGVRVDYLHMVGFMYGFSYKN